MLGAHALCAQRGQRGDDQWPDHVPWGDALAPCPLEKKKCAI